MPSIEYLDEAAVAPPSSPRPGRRGVVVALLLAVVVLGGLLIARAVTSGGRYAPPKPVRTYALARCGAGDAAPTPVTEQSDGARVTVGLPSDRTTSCSTAVADCPRTDACTTATSLSAALLRAVRARFPTAAVTRTRTETLRTGALWYRYVRFRLPPYTDLAVEVVRGHDDPAQAGEWDDGTNLFGRAVVRSGATVTSVSIEAPSGATSRLVTQYALARDPALAAR